jgi:hypothetical protein|nr:MAG TPA: hypothetical protein [Crassvirales sp.]
MAESKTFVFGQDANNGMLGLLAPLLQKQGLDPNMVMAMMNNRGGAFGGEGGWFMWVIFLFFLMGWGGNGFGGFGNRGVAGDAALGNLINNDNGRELLMQAIQGNANAISQLASTLNCSIGQVQQAINGVMSQVQQVGNQVGQSSMQIINAIQAGNCNIAQQIASCCCENRLAICQQTNTLQQSINNVANGQERGFSTIAYETQRQTCDIRDAIRENTAQVLAGQQAAEMRELNRDIAERDRKIAEQAVVINNGQQTAIFGQMIQQATAPIAAAVAGLQKDVDGVKCKLPDTATIPYSPVVGVPSCVAAQYGLGLGLGFGFPGAWG